MFSIRVDPLSSYRFADTIRDALIRIFDAYAAATDVPKWRVGVEFAKDKAFYDRLPLNRPSVRNADIILQRFSDSWPANAAWPENVPRPPRGKWDDLTAAISRPGGKPRPVARKARQQKAA